MRILYTTHQFLPEYSSGTEILTFSTAQEMKRRGHEVFVLTGFPPRAEKGQESLSDRYEYSGLTVDRFFCSQSPPWRQNRIQSEYHDSCFSRYLREKLEEVKPDVVHFYHLQRLSAEAIGVCAQLHIPTVFTATDFWAMCPANQLLYPSGAICDGPQGDAENCVRHLVALSQGSLVQSALEKTPDFILRSLIKGMNASLLPDAGFVSYVRAIKARQARMREMFSKVNRILVATSFMAEKFLEFGIEKDRISKLTFGIEVDRSIAPSTTKRKRETLVFGFIGTFYFHKGANVLIKAVNLAPPDLPIIVKLYGALEQFPEYVKMLRIMAGNDVRIVFCGTFPKERIGEVLEDLDVLVVPSLWHENSPLVIHAAQAAGVPVVGSNTGGVNEVIQDGFNGLLFTRGDAGALSRIMDRLCRDRKLVRKLSENAQKPTSVLHYGNGLEKIYWDMLGVCSGKRSWGVVAHAGTSEANQSENSVHGELKRLNHLISSLKELIRDDPIKNMPQWISFQTTYVCNLQCPLCQTHGTEEGRTDCNNRSRDMPRDILKKAAEEALPTASEFTLSLSGEPLETSRLEKTLSDLSRYGAKLDLITNGTLLKREKLAVVLPVARRIQISVDGGTAFTFEAIRQGARFKTLVRNIRLLTETIRLLPKSARPEVTFSCTILGSNMQELSEIVRLAAFCGVGIVNGGFAEIFYDRYENERVLHHKPFYNHCRRKALETAASYGILLQLPPPFEGVQPDGGAVPSGQGMILPELSKSDGSALPPPDVYIDWNTLKKDAQDLAAKVLNRVETPLLEKESLSDKDALLQNMKSSLTDFLQANERKLQGWMLEKEKKIKFCDYLYRCIYISPVGEVTPCCIVGSPILGNVQNNSVREIWNGPQYNEFRRRFLSENPFACCKHCKFLQYRSVESLFDEILCNLSSELVPQVHEDKLSVPSAPA